MTRGLVVLRCGRSSLHWHWLEGPRKNWDLILCPYQDIDARGHAARVIPGQKWDGLARYFAEFNGWRDYDYICLPDDDIATDTHTLNAFFDFCHRFQIGLAAPALTPDSYFSHPITMKNTEFVARRTSFVEIMMPCFSRAFFQEVLPTFGLSRSGTGFGLDYLWPHMLSYEDTWIFDDSAVHHTRPVGGLRQQRLAELAQADLTFIRGLGIPMTPKTLGGVGHDETFLRCDAQEFGKRYHRGNAYLASQIPEWSRHIDHELSSAAPATSLASRDHIRFALEHLAAPDRTVSRGRPSRSSSTSQWSWSNNPELEASGANDGRLNGCCGFHTNQELNPWWQVDLGTPHAIESVVIYNRLDQMMRCVDFDILVSDDAVSWRLAHAKRDGIPFGGVDGNPYKHDFVPPAGGRFIRIQLAGTGFLHLDQIEVFGSPGEGAPPLDGSSAGQAESPQTSGVVMTKYSLERDHAGLAPGHIDVPDRGPVPAHANLVKFVGSVSALQSAYSGCPLCAGASVTLGFANCTTHALWHEPLPPTIEWLRCASCGHTHNRSYWTEAGLAEVRRKEPDAVLAQFSTNLEPSRAAWSAVVGKVAGLLGGNRTVLNRDSLPVWVDVGSYDGTLIMTAVDSGFTAVGLDTRAAAVAHTQGLGFNALQHDFVTLKFEVTPDVLSMMDVLEQIPYPREALRKAAQVLRPGGVLVVGTADMASSSWRVMEAQKVNPYWTDLERHHNFSRGRLLILLRDCGFEIRDFAIAGRAKAQMEIYAVLKP